MVMVNFLPLRPLLRHRQQQLSQCSSSLPFRSDAGFESVQSSQRFSHLSSGHHAGEVGNSPHRCCPGKRNDLLHCSISAQSRRRLREVSYRGGVCSLDGKFLPKISPVSHECGQGHATGGASWRGRRIGGGGAKVNNKSGQLQLQLVGGYGYAGKRFSDDADTTRGASRSEGVECVREDFVEKKSDEAVLTDDDVRILANYMTKDNYVRVLEVSRTADSVLAGARVLLLDKPGNVHSIYQKYRVLTEAYYDILATLPAVIPEGPIGIFGLGAGTAARLIHYFWPEIDMHGWELDPGVVQAARNFFSLEELEWKESTAIIAEHNNPETQRRSSTRTRNPSGSYGFWADESDEVKLSLFHGLNHHPPENHSKNGRLRVHIGDALNPDPNVSIEGGKFAGLIVDLFAEGAVIPELQKVETWRRLRQKIGPRGRIMVNCGGSCVEAEEHKGVDRKDGEITMRETIAAIAEAFPGELSITNLRDHGDNSIALTGPPPDLAVWRDTLPECLRRGVEDWRPY